MFYKKILVVASSRYWYSDSKVFHAAETQQHKHSCIAQAENTGLPLQSCDMPALNRGSQQSIVSVSVHMCGGCGAPALWADLSSELMGTEHIKAAQWSVLLLVLVFIRQETNNQRAKAGVTLSPPYKRTTHTLSNTHARTDVIAIVIKRCCAGRSLHNWIVILSWSGDSLLKKSHTNNSWGLLLAVNLAETFSFRLVKKSCFQGKGSRFAQIINSINQVLPTKCLDIFEFICVLNVNLKCILLSF